MTLLIGNDQTVTVTGLKDEITGDFIEDATVTATIKDRSGNFVAGQSWPVTLTNVAGGIDGVMGCYQGNFEDGLLLSLATYVVEVTAIAPTDLVAYWRQNIVAEYRPLED